MSLRTSSGFERLLGASVSGVGLAQHNSLTTYVNEVNEVNEVNGVDEVNEVMDSLLDHCGVILSF